MRNLKRALDKRKALLLPASVEGDSLYIMQNTRIPNEVKVGRSGVITKRKKRMEECQNFTITVHVFYPGYGYLESRAHKLLRPLQLQNVPGREWFKCAPEHAMKVVSSILPENM